MVDCFRAGMNRRTLCRRGFLGACAAGFPATAGCLGGSRTEVGSVRASGTDLVDHGPRPGSSLREYTIVKVGGEDSGDLVVEWGDDSSTDLPGRVALVTWAYALRETWRSFWSADRLESQAATLETVVGRNEELQRTNDETAVLEAFVEDGGGVRDGAALVTELNRHVGAGPDVIEVLSRVADLLRGAIGLGNSVTSSERFLERVDKLPEMVRKAKEDVAFAAEPNGNYPGAARAAEVLPTIAASDDAVDWVAVGSTLFPGHQESIDSSGILSPKGRLAVSTYGVLQPLDGYVWACYRLSRHLKEIEDAAKTVANSVDDVTLGAGAPADDVMELAGELAGRMGGTVDAARFDVSEALDECSRFHYRAEETAKELFDYDEDEDAVDVADIPTFHY